MHLPRGSLTTGGHAKPLVVLVNDVSSYGRLLIGSIHTMSHMMGNNGYRLGMAGVRGANRLEASKLTDCWLRPGPKNDSSQHILVHPSKYLNFGRSRAELALSSQ